MSLETVLFTRLSTFSGLTALISTRVYPMVLPQDCTLPAVSYAEISCPRVHTMGADPGLKSPRFQFTAWATTYAGAKAVAEQIRAALQDWTNSTGTVIQATLLDNEADTYDSETNHYGIPVDFIIWAEE